MSYTLRPYQQKASDIALQFLTTPQHDTAGLIVLPTGAGKSLVIADIAYRLGEPILVFQPGREILIQNYEKLCSYGAVGCSIYSASMNRKERSWVTFATIGSVMAHKEAFKIYNYIIIDECHGVNPAEGMYKEFLAMKRFRIIGLTATPYRLFSGFEGHMLRFLTRMKPCTFTRLLYYVQVGDLAKCGYLARVQYYEAPSIDRSRLKKNSTGLGFTDQSVKLEYKRKRFPDHLLDIVRRLLTAGRKSILVFTAFTEEAEHLVKALGGASAVVSAKTPSKERARILEAFKSGKIRVVANVGVLTTGFDFPSLSTVVLARATNSLGLYYQMVGRVIRPCRSETKWLVDLCGNYRKFGRVEDLRLWVGGHHNLPIVYGGNGKQLTNVYL